MKEITEIIQSIAAGDARAASELLPLVYGELRRLAAQRLAQERPGQTLEATALVHEVYLRLVGVSHSQLWDGRGHFFAAAAEAMRRILVENARRKQRIKHGGEVQRVDVDVNLVASPVGSIDLLALDQALMRLARGSPVRAELVKLRFFAGQDLRQQHRFSHREAHRQVDTPNHRLPRKQRGFRKVL